jgi:UDP-N-acetylglucosamine acyltransferase
MPIAESARIHPTAVVPPEADLAEHVEVGPYVVLEGPVRLGPGCRLRPFVHLIGPVTLGCDNVVFTGCVLGERPQHLRYNDEPTRLEIGDHNIFRENVTVHRGTTHSWATRIGSHNFFMAGAHVAHDSVIGNHCILANGALVGGHCTVGDRANLSGNAAIHQFVRVGRLALLGGVSAATMDMPPFMIQQGINNVVGVNVVGMRRAGLSAAQIDAVRQAFGLLFRRGLTIPSALSQIEKELGSIDVIAELIDFVRGSKRGIATMRAFDRSDVA